MFFEISKIKFMLLIRLIMQKGFEHWAKTSVAVFVIGGFFYGVYFIFYKIFKYLTSVQDIGYALSDRLISLGFLAFFTMLLISNIISSISTLFRSRETRYLMATPLNKNQVFWVRFMNNFFFSSWATLVIGLPMAISYMVTNTMSIWYIVWVFGALMLFLIIPAFIGSIISMLLMPAVKKLSFKWSVVTLIGITSIIAYSYVKSNLSGGLMFNVLGDMTMLNYYFRQLGSHRTPFFPHIWFTEIISALRQGQNMRAFLFTSALASTTFFGFFITDYVSKKIFQTSFEAAETMTHKKHSKSTSLHNSKLWRLLSFLKQDVRSLWVKDIKLFIRDPNQWSQFAVLLVLLVLYLVNLKFIPSKITSTYLRTVIAFANFAFCGYILATLSVRFVYPGISMEGKSLWSLATAPIGLKKLFWEKYTLSFVTFIIIAEIIAVISNGLLSQSNLMTIITATGIFLMSIALVSLNMGLGILFPTFEELNPMRIASSGGGMIAALLSLVYVGLTVILLAMPTYRYILFVTTGKQLLIVEIVTMVGLLIILNLITIILPIKLGLKAIDKREF